MMEAELPPWPERSVADGHPPDGLIPPELGLCFHPSGESREPARDRWHPTDGSRYRSGVPGPAAREFEDFEVGDTASIERVIGADDVARFVDLTGDDNPVHVDDGYARALGAGGRVVHGMLTASYVSTLIGTLLPGPGAIWLSQNFNFRVPVRIDDKVELTATVRRVSPATRILVLAVAATNQHGAVVLDGEARVRLLYKMPPMGLRKDVGASAVVTGASRGLGAEIARRLAALGTSVVVNYTKDEKSAVELVARIRESGGAAESFQADIVDASAVSSLMRFAEERHGPVDVLVNNAGPTIGRSPLTATSWEDLERELGVHLKGSFQCVRAVLPGMIEQRFGRIVNITSQSAYGAPPPNMSGYVIAKAALAAFTRCIAAESGPFGVTANAVAPGLVETSLVADVSPSVRLATAAQSPLRQLTSPADVADAVAFLVGPAGASVTGQTIHLSGGQVMT